MSLVTHWYQPWPTVSFSSARLWDTDTSWAQINTAPGAYDWTTLDAWIEASGKHQVDLLYTLGDTPAFASSNPSDTTCNEGVGECDAPNDVNADGTGTDQSWKEFVTAIATHVGGSIQYWEVWNEPGNLPYWTGTYAQMARMAEDARSIILSINPDARMLTPGNASLEAYDMKWWSNYSAAGGLQWADIIATHASVNFHPMSCGVYPQPENLTIDMNNLRADLDKYGAGSKPIWDTEGSWGVTSTDCFTNPDLQAAFLARYYLMHFSEGIVRFYWRGWEDSEGGLWTPSAGVNEAGVAYQQMYSWLVGATLTKSCSPNGTVWTCNLSRSNGYAAQAVWDTSLSCGNGTCASAPFPAQSQYVRYRNIAGQVTEITGPTVPIGAKPILLEN
jgi:polysaccharide biosynthesis protein PslG